MLFAIGLAVTVFRGAYEQVGNTVALWADSGVDRATSLLTIPMTWFQSLNPLLVFLMTPLLLARWRRQAAAGRAQSSMRKMATGSLMVAAAYLLLAAVAFALSSLVLTPRSRGGTTRVQTFGAGGEPTPTTTLPVNNIVGSVVIVSTNEDDKIVYTGSPATGSS